LAFSGAIVGSMGVTGILVLSGELVGATDSTG